MSILGVLSPNGVIPVLSLTAPDPDGSLVDVSALLAAVDYAEARARHPDCDPTHDTHGLRPAGMDAARGRTS